MIRVILIDDHALFREGLKAMMQPRADLSVVGDAENAQSGLDIVRKVPCDLVVTDYSLPDHDAVWLVGAIRAFSNKLPILVVSQFTALAKVREVLELGAQGYLVKSAQPQEFLSALTTVAGGGIYLHSAVSQALLPLRAHQDALGLSPRERQVLQLVVQGESNPAMAKRLQVSLGTIKNDLQHLFGKFGVSDRTRLATLVLSQGLLESPND